MLILALSPILWLVVALTIMKMQAHKACIIALILSLAVAMGMYGMSSQFALESVLEGVALACWPILLTIIAAIFTYNLTLKTKAMDTIKSMLISVSDDKRVLILLIGWGFGAFLEGMAGFGTAVAIPAGMLAGIGISPLLAASVCLVANSVPTAFGSIGIPLVTLGNVTGIDASTLAFYAALQLAPMSMLCPFVMVFCTSMSPKALKGMFMLCLVSGISYIIPNILVSMIMGPELAVVAASVVTMCCIVLFAKKFPVQNEEYRISAKSTNNSIDLKKAFISWCPFIFIFVLLLLTSKLIPAIHDPLNLIKTSVLIYSGQGGSPYTFTWIATPGIMIFLSAIIGGTLQKATASDMVSTLRDTVVNLRFTVVTIITVIATAKVMGYSGMTLQIADAAVSATGHAYPAIAAFIGSMGTFITGSGTSSCVLFGKLQVDSATAIGATTSATQWLAASNATGACMGKMISPQNIAIAVAAISLTGAESKLLQFAFKIYLPYIIIVGCIVYFGYFLV